MNDNVEIINPTLSINIPLVTALMHSVHGANPGRLRHYKVYTLENTDGTLSYYSLTLSVLQFIANPLAPEKTPELRMDVIEPTIGDEGQFGCVLPVIKSIIPKDGKFVFDETGSYVVKEIIVDRDGITDKPGKPNWEVRLTNREHYLGSQIPHLGVHYELIKEKDITFLHMNRVPGLPLQHYIGKLNGVEFLTLACSLLEEIPKQIHRAVSSGKHAGEVIVHCDLKESNIMAELKNNQWTLSVIDMGLAKTMKEGKYSSLHQRGNLMVWDSTMLYAALRDKQIHFNAQTDLYALYVIISNLAGAPSRGDLKDTNELFTDLDQPNLSGAFSKMGFDTQTREKLKFLLREMLHDNRKKRVSAPEVLAVFRETLTEMKLAQAQVQPENKPEITAKHLMDWIKKELGKNIRAKEKKGVDKSDTVKAWISHFRELYSLADKKEKRKFSNLLKKEINVPSLYVFNLFRFRLLDEYDDDASTRLLLRHHELTNSFRLLYRLPEHWGQRFNILAHQIPIQLSATQASICNEIGTFKKNASTVLNHEITGAKVEPFLTLLTGELDYQMSLKFDDWVNQLPALIRPFNQLFDCTTNLIELEPKFKKILHLNEHFEKQFDEWSNALLDQSISGALPEKLQRYFKNYHLLADMLFVYDENHEADAALLNDFPALKHSTLCYTAVKASIENLNILDYQSVIELAQKIKLLFTLIDLHSWLCKNENDSFYRSYKRLFKECRVEFSEHIDKITINQSHTDKPINAQLDLMLERLDELDGINSFIKGKISHYYYITTTLYILLNDASRILKLREMIKEYVHRSGNFINLNAGLKELLPPKYNSQSDSNVSVDEKLFSELTRFFACPNRYKPQSIRIYSKTNPHTIFAPSPSKEVENALHLSPEFLNY